MLAKTKIRRNKRGEMGVGTMIIFIAMVLVAAVAASVLISTANTVREQAQSTGTDAINNVASGFVVYSVMGEVGNTTNSIDNCYLYVRLAAGSPSIDMSLVTILVTDGANQVELAFDNATADASHYLAEPVQGTMDNNFVAQGDLIKITIGGTGNELGWDTSTHVQIKLMPSHGMPTLSEFTTPETYLSSWITLR
ncbi:MAG TPA: archaellin/type IV pilin N-terminal domain-containing protein [Methanomassiliicoccales archaeon]|nr:archaellin/type IV pilin N-terminal domain-containing protein [Methanomassiliicoccales archaeon]